MIKRALESFTRTVADTNKALSLRFNQIPIKQQNACLNNKQILGNLKIQYSFARKLFKSQNIIETNQPISTQNIQPLKVQKNVKSPSQQIYTFTDLDNDLQKYQSFLNIFNTHTKKAHEKLLTNQIKIISTIIQNNRNDLLQKFLAVNYRNRLANPQTTKIITQHFKTQLHKNIEKISTKPEESQQTLQRITLLTQFNQFGLFNEYVSLLVKKLNLTDTSDKYLKILESLPCKESQLLFMYNLLMKEKELPLSIMQSKYYGLNTDNLNFYKLGQIFYELRKFMRRYFAIYSKKLQVNQQKDELEQEGLKSFERQSQKSSQPSLIEDNVFCFLKTLNLQNVRKQILIDGFAVDFVIEKSDSNKKVLKKQSKTQNLQTYILEVMGSYHYTSTGQLKGKDLRKLILLSSKYRTKKYFVKILHFDDYNKSKGHRNKMELIKNLLESNNKEVNWEPKNQGYDSKWQLKQVYDQLK